MNVFTLKSAKVMGQDEKFGNSYWCYVEEIDLPVMFSSHSTLKGFETIAAEETDKKVSKAGNDYLLLKKVKVAESSGAQGSESKDNLFSTEPKATKPSSAAEPSITDTSTSAQLQTINRKLDEILEYVTPLDKVAPLEDGDYGEQENPF